VWRAPRQRFKDVHHKSGGDDRRDKVDERDCEQTGDRDSAHKDASGKPPARTPAAAASSRRKATVSKYPLPKRYPFSVGKRTQFIPGTNR
jgi:hypothetical protein